MIVRISAGLWGSLRSAGKVHLLHSRQLHDFMAVPCPGLGLVPWDNLLVTVPGLAQVKKKLNKELISSSITYVWCQIREECMSCIQRRCSLLTPSTKFDSAIQNQESPWACLYQEPGTVWSRSVQTFSNLAAGTFTGSCSRVNKCQLKEIPCKGTQTRQNWEWCYWNHSSRSISCPRVALTWVLPCLFFSTKFRKTS